MKKDVLKRDGKYNIPYTSSIEGNEKKIVIVIHGFGSSKESPTAQMMLTGLPAYGIGAVAFDFPAHGESPVDGDAMSVDGCIDDLKSIETMVRTEYPDSEVYYFGSSFGAYIALNHITKNDVKGTRLFCRSGAVNMPDIFKSPDKEQKEYFENYGYIMLDYDPGRPLKVTSEFVSELMENDLFDIFKKTDVLIKMIHGDSDETISYDRVVEFTDKFNIPLITVKGGDHRLSIEGAPERVLKEAIEFFLK